MAALAAMTHELKKTKETKGRNAMFIRALVVAGLALCGAAVAAVPAASQPYPHKVIKLVVPFTAGGPVDVMARVVAQQLSIALGQPVVIDNRPGAGGTLAAKSVAIADPEGYTLLFGSAGSQVISPALYRNIGYDPVTAFAPVAMVSNVPNVLVVTPSLPVRTLQEFVSYAKSRPGKLNYGAVIGTPPHLMVELFKLTTGTDIVLIPYKGAAQATTDMIAGQIDMSIFAMSTMAAAVKDGRLRGLAMTSAARQPQLPDVPTMRESGIADFPPGSWQGILAPAQTPRDIVVRLNTVINECLRSPELVASFAKLGAYAVISTPEEFTAAIATETKKWQAVAQAASLKAE